MTVFALSLWKKFSWDLPYFGHFIRKFEVIDSRMQWIDQMQINNHLI